jgi:hypothetical protein
MHGNSNIKNNSVSCRPLRIILVLYNKASVKEQDKKLRGNVGNYLTIGTMLEFDTSHPIVLYQYNSILVSLYTQLFLS